jgi:hypothetical protein
MELFPSLAIHAVPTVSSAKYSVLVVSQISQLEAKNIKLMIITLHLKTKPGPTTEDGQAA